MTEEKKNSLQYRFSGYLPPLIQLDSTGAAYWLKFYTHPYYVNQPAYWKQPAYRNGANYFRQYENNPEPTESSLYVQLPVCRK